MTKAKAQTLPEIEVTPETLSPHGSEDSLALEFTSRHSDKLRYVALWGKWLKYDGTRWRIDATREVYDLSSDLCREFALRQNSKGKKAIASAKTRGNVVALAGEKRKIAATVSNGTATTGCSILPVVLSICGPERSGSIVLMIT
jgi:hypothetical protein